MLIFSSFFAKITGKMRGDPDVSPVVDRYRVYRQSRKIEWLEKIEDNWVPYSPAQMQ